MSNAKGHMAVIGAGTMGGDISVIFAAKGWHVHVVEAIKETSEILPGRLETGLMELKAKFDPKRLSIYADLEELNWDRIEIVVECVTENLSLKKRVFKELDRLSSAGIPLTSNSSGFPISEISKGLKSQERMLGLHFFMPAHLVPLVEVVSSEFTDPALARQVYNLMTSLGRKPVWVKRDIPGFLANRIQHALMREAIWLVEQGLASPEDVDTSVRYGFGFRYVAAGPLRQKDFSGLDVQCAAAEAVYPGLCNDTKPSSYLKDKVNAGEIGIKSKKGFFIWTDEDISTEKARYKSALLRALNILKEDDRKG